MRRDLHLVHIHHLAELSNPIAWGSAAAADLRMGIGQSNSMSSRVSWSAVNGIVPSARIRTSLRFCMRRTASKTCSGSCSILSCSMLTRPKNESTSSVAVSISTSRRHPASTPETIHVELDPVAVVRTCLGRGLQCGLDVVDR